MAVRTKRLGKGVAAGAGAGFVAYTCPAGHTAIVKDVRLANVVGVATAVVVAAHSGPTFVNVFVANINAAQVASFAPYLVLGPGDSLEMSSSVAAGFTYWVSGTELDGVAT